MTTSASNQTPEDSTPPLPFDGEVTDQQEAFRELTAATVREPESEYAFMASKLKMLRTDDRLSADSRSEAGEQLARAFDLPSESALAEKAGPVPGGVGYGMFYTPAFRTAFSRGTAFYYEIVCPHQPGGNVNTWLYLTATNRAQKGVEAFVSYHAQDTARFKIFDWARSDHWQTDIGFGDLGNYLRGTAAHGWGLQTLLVWNSSWEIGPGRWRNEVLLHNRATNQWDRVYQYDYDSNPTEQAGGWVGSWGPIVETFQDSYSSTRWLGFLNTMLIARNAAGTWGNWGLLTSSQSTIRNDGHGFSPLFLDPNYSFAVKS